MHNLRPKGWVIADWLRMKIYGNEVPKRDGEKPEATKKFFLMKKSWCYREIYGVRSLWGVEVGTGWYLRARGMHSNSSRKRSGTYPRDTEREIFSISCHGATWEFFARQTVEVDWLVRDYSLLHSTTHFVIVQLEDEWRNLHKIFQEISKVFYSRVAVEFSDLLSELLAAALGVCGSLESYGKLDTWDFSLQRLMRTFNDESFNVNKHRM